MTEELRRIVERIEMLAPRDIAELQADGNARTLHVPQRLTVRVSQFRFDDAPDPLEVEDGDDLGEVGDGAIPPSVRLAMNPPPASSITEQQAADIAECIRLCFAELLPTLRRSLAQIEEDEKRARAWRKDPE